MQSQKWQTDVRFQGKPFTITVIQVYAPTTNAEEAEVEQFYEALQDLLELTPKKDALFIIGDWNAKLGSQELPGVTGKFVPGVQNEAGQRLPEFCQRNALVTAITLFQQHQWRPYTWTSPSGQYLNQFGYIFYSQRWRSWIQSAKTRPGPDCGSDHELLIAKFRLKLKKVGKTTRPFSESESLSSCQTLLRPHGLYNLWNSLGQNTGVKYEAFPFSRGSSLPRGWTQVSTMQADSLPTELSGKTKAIQVCPKSNFMIIQWEWQIDSMD